MPLAGGFGGRVKLNEQRFCSAPVCSDYCRLPKERRPRRVFLSPAIKSPKPGHDSHVCTFVAEAASVHSGGVVHGMQEGGPPVVLVLRTLERRTINAQHEHAAAWHRLRFYSSSVRVGSELGVHAEEVIPSRIEAASSGAKSVPQKLSWLEQQSRRDRSSTGTRRRTEMRIGS